MSRALDFRVAPAEKAPVHGLRMVEPEIIPDPSRCEIELNLGFFFDGTQNNRNNDQGRLAHTNIARLAAAYPDDREIGYFREYIPGVGTPFPDIGEHASSDFGLAFGAGCEGRILFALLRLINCIHWISFNHIDRFTSEQILALCRNSEQAGATDLLELRKLHLSSGLLQPPGDKPSMRRAFFARHEKLLCDKLKGARPKVVCCYVDVFGFSRGAAEARVFCNWLTQLVEGGKFCDIPLRIRFLGIFDTVASVGAAEGAVGFMTKGTGGHDGWATVESMRIPPLVENCVHMVAMHELRRNFPLDEVGVNGIMPPGCFQYAYPGAHSDVGGGYSPSELGVSFDKDVRRGDALKLSQIPLNHMLACAQAAGAPLDKDLFTRNRSADSRKSAASQPAAHDPFTIDPRLEEAYQTFLSFSSLAPRPLNAWLQPYLNWRWQVRHDFNRLNHVRLANDVHHKLLHEFNQRLIGDAELMKRTSGTAARRAVAALLDWNWSDARRDEAKVRLLDPEARQVLALAQAAAPTPEPLRHFFDNFVHDSLAGFNRPTLEYTGYWRYRKGFLGNDKALIVSNDSEEKAQDVA